MSAERLAWRAIGLLVILAIGGTGCADDFDPYAELSESELALVIPGSAERAPGTRCLSGDCSGETAPTELADSGSWLLLDEIELLDDRAGTIEVELRPTSTIAGPEVSGTLRRSMFFEDARWTREALDAGLEVVVHVDGESVPGDGVHHVISFDDAGRLAAIGVGQGVRLTVPLVRAAHATGAETGRSYALASIGAETPAALDG